MLLFNIVTPCIRINNLSIVLESIIEAKQNLNITINWYIVIDVDKFEEIDDVKKQIEFLKQSWQQTQIEIHILYYKPKIKTKPQSPRNEALKLITSGLVCFIDDDTITHPNYFLRICQVITDLQLDPSQIAIVYNQQLAGNQIRCAAKHRVEINHIDTGQFTVARQLIGNFKWGMLRGSDGRFIKKIQEFHPDKFVILDEILSYYNYISKRKYTTL